MNEQMIHTGLSSDNLSIMSMFLNADWVVKAVMIILILASVMSWTIFAVKKLQLHYGLSRIERLLEDMAQADLMSSLCLSPLSREIPEANLIEIAKIEVLKSQKYSASREGVKERVAQGLHMMEKKLVEKMTKGTGMLASISSTAPFVGLFGTVWGIMNSFIGIAASNTTNLSVVAPGIAEALLATGAGLVAAIPAALFYNYFSRATATFRQGLAEISGHVMILLSRQLDENREQKNPAVALVR